MEPDGVHTRALRRSRCRTSWKLADFWSIRLHARKHYASLGPQGERTSEPQDIVRPCYYRLESMYVRCPLAIPREYRISDKQRRNDDGRNCIVQ